MISTAPPIRRVVGLFAIALAILHPNGCAAVRFSGRKTRGLSKSRSKSPGSSKGGCVPVGSDSSKAGSPKGGPKGGDEPIVLIGCDMETEIVLSAEATFCFGFNVTQKQECRTCFWDNVNGCSDVEGPGFCAAAVACSECAGCEEEVTRWLGCRNLMQNKCDFAVPCDCS